MKVFAYVISFLLFPFLYNLSELPSSLDSEVINSLEDYNVLPKLTSDEEIPGPMEYIYGMLQSVIIALAHNNTLSDFSETCKETLDFIVKPENIHYIKKFLRDSASNKNDVESYYYCAEFVKNSSQEGDEDMELLSSEPSYNQTEFIGNLTYLILQIKKENWVSRADMRFVSGKYLLGVCFKKGCTEEEYSKIFYQMNYEMDNPFQLFKREELSLFDMENYTEGFSSKFFLSLIPFYIIIVLFIFSCFPSIPAFLFSCWFKKAKRPATRKSSNIFDKLRDDDQYNDDLIEDQDEVEYKTDDVSFFSHEGESKIMKKIKTKLKEKKTSTKTINTDEIKLYEFKACFSITENTDEFFSSKHSRYSSDSGMSNVRGLRGFSMLFMVIGNIYLYLMTSPLKIYSEFQHKALLTSTFYGLLQFGLRYAPRILITCSGFSLAYKFLCYLDEVVDNSEEQAKESVNSELDKKKSNINPSNLMSLHDKDLFSDEKRTEYPEVKLIHLFRFISYQLYKYVLFVLMVFYFKFSFYQLPNLFLNPSPIWVYLKTNIIDVLTPWRMVGTFFLFAQYTYFGSEIPNLFWLAICEIFFFLITSIVIFISYKKNFRMDIFFILFWVILVACKPILLYTSEEGFYIPSQTIYTDGRANFYTSLNYNYPFYLIGVFFGMVNYVIQKSITRSQIIQSGKTYLNVALWFVKFYKGNRGVKVIVITVFGVALSLFIAISYPILYAYSSSNGGDPDKFMKNFHLTKWVSVFYLLDTEIFIIIILLIFISLFILGDNFFVDFFSHEYWSFISRSYFSFILICDQVILYIFYQSETRIKLEIFNILFFSLFTVSLTVIISIFVYVILEMPYKKINKNFWQPFKRKEEDDKVNPFTHASTPERKYNKTIEETLFSRTMDD